MTTLKGKTNNIYSWCPKLALPLRAEFRKTEIEEWLWSALQLRDSPVRPSSAVTAANRGGLAPSRLMAPERDAKMPRDDQWQQINGRDQERQGSTLLFALTGKPCQHIYRCRTTSSATFLASKCKKEENRLSIYSGRWHLGPDHQEMSTVHLHGNFLALLWLAHTSLSDPASNSQINWLYSLGEWRPCHLPCLCQATRETLM